MVTGKASIMATETTLTSAKAWAPDQNAFSPGDAVPDALILAHSNVAGVIEGDAPVMRVAYIDDAAATVSVEGVAIDEANPALSEATIHTAKITQLVKLSQEQYRQAGTAQELAQSVQRAIVTKSNSLFLAQAAPGGGATAPAAGLLNVPGIEDGGAVAGNLDALVDLVALLEANGGTPTGILLSPIAWASLRKFKTATGSELGILGAGTNDAEKRLLDLPVTVSSALGTNTGLVIDRNAIVSAVGPVRVDTDESVYFNSDSVALRATWRTGHNAVRPDRIGKFTVTAPVVE